MSCVLGGIGVGVMCIRWHRCGVEWVSCVCHRCVVLCLFGGILFTQNVWVYARACMCCRVMCTCVYVYVIGVWVACLFGGILFTQNVCVYARACMCCRVMCTCVGIFFT